MAESSELKEEVIEGVKVYRVSTTTLSSVANLSTSKDRLGQLNNYYTRSLGRTIITCLYDNLDHRLYILRI